ncbi:MAG: hypothetical protein R3B49_09855 [Phycisphaerales bacterium]
MKAARRGARRDARPRGKSIVTDHDAFGRFCNRYGIQVAAVVRPFETPRPTPGERWRRSRDGDGGWWSSSLVSSQRADG